MATSSFDKTFIFTDEATQRNILAIVDSDEPGVPISIPPYSKSEEDRSEEVLKQFLLNYKRS